jgi:hypothetical protein
MCEFFTLSGSKCKIKSKGDRCHIHKGLKEYKVYESLLECADREIYNLNLKIKKRDLTIQCREDQINDLSNQVSVLGTHLKQQEYDMNDLKYQIDILECELRSLEYDSKRYNDIKNYENLKVSLSKYCDITDFNDIYNFLIDSNNNLICEKLMGKHKNYFSCFNTMRFARNQAAHFI